MMGLSVAAGAMIAFQAPINAKLGQTVGVGALFAAFSSFAVGTVALFIVMVVNQGFPDWSALNKTHVWMWCGGLLGAVFVYTSISVVPVLGAALMISLFVLGQLLGALFIDKTGFLLPVSAEIGWERIVGVVLILGGVILFSRSV